MRGGDERVVEVTLAAWSRTPRLRREGRTRRPRRWLWFRPRPQDSHSDKLRPRI